MASFGRDLRYGLRVLRLSPGFTIVAILTLALGIGANTAIFQLIDAIRLRTIPVKNPEELAVVKIADRKWGSGNFQGRYSQITFPMWEQIRKRQESFSAISAWGTESFNLATGGEAHYAQGIWVSGDFFNVLGVHPLLGRLISPEDDQPGCGSAAVNISYAFWQRNYGGDPTAIGKRMTLEGSPFVISGITPSNFKGISVGDSFDVAVPICSEPVIHREESRLTVRHSWWLATIGRLKPGRSVAQATAQLNAISPAILQETIPPFYDAEGVKNYLAYRFAAYPASTGFSNLRRDSETPLWLLLGISGMVLLIACANLANLMLVRASARERQIAIRMALGATRAQLIGQLLSECLLLAVAGAIGGLLLAEAVSRALVAFVSKQNSPIVLDLAMDWRVLAFTGGLAIFTTLLFGLTPALRSTTTEPGAVLQSGSRGMTGGRERFSLRRILVSSQVALCLMLLVSALLFTRSLRNLLTLDAGFQQNGILVTSVQFSRADIPKERRVEYRREIVDRLRQIPGVESVAGARVTPIGGNSSNRYLLGDNSENKRGTTWLNYVSPGFFKTLGTPLLSGRDFNDNDTSTSPKIAIVNQAFVRKFLNGGEALGKTFRMWESPGKPVPVYEIVGIVANAKYQDLHEDFLPTAYFPASQESSNWPEEQIVIRSQVSLAGLIASVKQAIGQMNPDIDLEFKVFKTQIRDSLLQDELMATLSGVFGFLAALLAAIGLYGVISYMVAQRTREIGIRMAIGAQGRDVIWMIMREAGFLTLIGLAVGTGLALFAARSARSIVFGLKPRDPLTFAMAILTLAVVAALASFIPSYRASKLDPVVALREE